MTPGQGSTAAEPGLGGPFEVVIKRAETCLHFGNLFNKTLSILLALKPIFISTSPRKQSLAPRSNFQVIQVSTYQIRIRTSKSSPRTPPPSSGPALNLLPTTIRASAGICGNIALRLHPHEKLSKHNSKIPAAGDRRSAGLTPVIQLSDQGRPQNCCKINSQP